MIIEKAMNEIGRREEAAEQAAIDAKEAAHQLLRDSVIADLKDEDGPPLDELIAAIETLGRECPSLREIADACHKIRISGGLETVAHWRVLNAEVHRLEQTRLDQAAWTDVRNRRSMLTLSREGWEKLQRMFVLTDALLKPYLLDLGELGVGAKLVGPADW